MALADMSFADLVRLVDGALSAVVIVALAWWNVIQRGENKALAEKHLADKDADKERLLKMADQNRELAVQAVATTAANTAALEAQRLRDERLMAALARAEGK